MDMTASDTEAAVRLEPVEVRTVSSPEEVPEALGDRSRPVLLRGFAADWPAMQKWSFDYFKETYGDLDVEVLLDLMNEGVPYENLASQHNTDMSVASFIDRLTGGGFERPAYMAQRPLHLFPGTTDDLWFDRIPGATEGDIQAALWIGTGGTRSGLHYDRYNNFFFQVCGRKRFYLASPKDAGLLYPFPDYVQKSRVDPEAPRFETFPKLRGAKFQTVVVEPGDLVFMPKQWWHFICSLDASISVNYWYGESIGLFAQLAVVAQSGVSCWARTIRDFVWLGMLGRPYHNRAMSEAPTGKFLYDQLIGYRLNRAE